MFRRCEGQGRGGVWRSLHLFVKKPMILVIFWGVGGPDLLTPPLYGFITQKSRESVETLDTPPNTLG